MKATTISLLCAGGLLFGTGCASSNYTKASRSYPDSEALRASVKTALWQDPSVAPFDIGVDASRGTVHLTGVVDTLEQKRRAGEIALAVPGIRSVDNDLVLRPGLASSGSGSAARMELGRAVEDPALLLGRVVATPDVYYGKTLEVEGTVDTILSATSFTMYSAGMRENPVLVLSREGDLRNLTPGDIVRVHGELQPFNRTSAAQRLRTELDARKFDIWANRASVLADSVRRL